MATYALIDRLSYLEERDLAAPAGHGYRPALTTLHAQYPELRSFISSSACRPFVKERHELCQLAADLFTWAAITCPHEEA